MFSIQVENSRPSHFFMINEKSRDLFIFDVDMNSHNEEAEVFTFKQLCRERLITVVPSFDYIPGIKYYQDQECIVYGWKGNIARRSIINHERILIQLDHKIHENDYRFFITSDSKSIVYRSDDENIYFSEAMWGKNNKSISYMLKECSSVTFKEIEFDTINSQFCCLTKPGKIWLFNNLNSYQEDVRGTFNYK